MDLTVNSQMLQQAVDLVVDGWRLDVIVHHEGQTGLVFKNFGSYVLLWPGGEEISYLTYWERQKMIALAMAARNESLARV